MNKSLLLKAIALSTAVAVSACGGKTESDSDTSFDNAVFAPTPVEEVIVEEGPTAEEIMMSELEEMVMSSTVVYFGFDQSSVEEDARAILDAHAKYLSLKADAQVVLEGHADERGTPEYNLALGERRATAVASYLKLQGVAAEQISVVSMGEELPADFGTTEEAYAKNRRVEIKYQ